MHSSSVTSCNCCPKMPSCSPVQCQALQKLQYVGQLRQRKRRISILSVDSRSTFGDLSAVKMISFTLCFILLGNTHGFPQLESFDQFFEKFGSTQFTRPTSFNPPSNSQPPPPQTPQFQSSARYFHIHMYLITNL